MLEAQGAKASLKDKKAKQEEEERKKMKTNNKTKAAAAAPSSPEASLGGPDLSIRKDSLKLAPSAADKKKRAYIRIEKANRRTGLTNSSMLPLWQQKKMMMTKK